MSCQRGDKSVCWLLCCARSLFSSSLDKILAAMTIAAERNNKERFAPIVEGLENHEAQQLQVRNHTPKKSSEHQCLIFNMHSSLPFHVIISFEGKWPSWFSGPYNNWCDSTALALNTVLFCDTVKHTDAYYPNLKRSKPLINKSCWSWPCRVDRNLA